MQVEERGGFIWLFWGDKSLPADERPPIPWAPELEDPSWKAVYGEIEFECGHWGKTARAQGAPPSGLHTVRSTPHVNPLPVCKSCQVWHRDVQHYTQPVAVVLLRWQMIAIGVFENAIDMAHIHYLHNDSFGNSEKPRILDMTTSRDTFHVEANFRCGWCCWQARAGCRT